jgi:hypothetical protein
VQATSKTETKDEKGTMKQSELAPLCFETLDFCLSQERRLIELLTKPGHGKKDQRRLENLLAAVRGGLAAVNDMISDWGLVRPPDQKNRLNLN